MKKFTIPCDFAGRKAGYAFYVGKPSEFLHPLEYQKMYLERERGGKIPEEVMDSFKKLQNIAVENKVDFEELTMYALGSASDNKGEDKKEAE